MQQKESKAEDGGGGDGDGDGGVARGSEVRSTRNFEGNENQRVKTV
jgi:hypothetical protein